MQVLTIFRLEYEDEKQICTCDRARVRGRPHVHFLRRQAAEEIRSRGGSDADRAASLARDEAIGFAMVAGKTTGGGTVTPRTVQTFAELKAAAQDDAPRVIIVAGTIKTEGGSGMRIGSNKTIVGADKNATIHGGLSINSVSNVVILRNFNMQGIWPHTGPAV